MCENKVKTETSYFMYIVECIGNGYASFHISSISTYWGLYPVEGRIQLQQYTYKFHPHILHILLLLHCSKRPCFTFVWSRNTEIVRPKQQWRNKRSMLTLMGCVLLTVWRKWFYYPDSQVHVAHLGPIGPRWAPFWPHEPCYDGDIGW